MTHNLQLENSDRYLQIMIQKKVYFALVVRLCNIIEVYVNKAEPHWLIIMGFLSFFFNIDGFKK